MVVSNMVGLALPYIGMLTFFFLLLESITYIGFISQFVFFNSLFFLILLLIFYLFYFLLQLLSPYNAEPKYLLQFFISLNYLIFPITLIFFYIIMVLEQSNFSNYVYANYHIRPEILRNFVIANMFIVLIDTFFRRKNLHFFNDGFRKYFLNTVLGLEIKETKKNLSKLVFFDLMKIITGIALISWFILTISQNSIKTSELLVTNYIFISKNPFISYELKMQKTWGIFFKYMQLVKASTPEDAVILIPPAQNHWLTSGNSVLVRYFLFPRTIVNVKETDDLDNLNLFPDVDFGYVLLSKGEWPDKTVPYVWPKKRLPTSHITYFDLNSSESSIVATEWYEPMEHEDKDVWGVIEIRKMQR